MKIKTIIINKKEYIYKLLTPQDLLSLSEENDFTIFQIKKTETMYEKILKEISEDKDLTSKYYNEHFHKNIINNILKICLIEYDNELFKKKENSKNIQLFLFNSILIDSLKFFKIPPEINYHTALVIDSIAKRYSKLPIDIILEKNEYNVLDSYLFNKEICSIGIENDIKQLKSKMKKL